MRVAVTGGSGLVGRAITARLAGPHDVVNVDIADPPERTCPHVRADILDPGALDRALERAEAVVHAAAVPGPRFGTEDEILRTNVAGTREVALAADRAGARRIVFISSEAVLGFVFSGGKVRPSYLPVDEAHPLSPTEPYGVSKLLAEAALARHAGPNTTVVSLRAPWVWVREEYEKCRKLTETPDEWWDGLWAYVHGDDLADAVAAALDCEPGPGAHAAYVAAPDNGTSSPTRELVARFYPGVPLAPELPKFGSLISSDELEKLTGFRPAMTWRSFL